jgi:hypothetical protein
VLTRKLKFTGKGYRIKKSRLGKSARLVFGHSHRLNLVFSSCRLTRLAKTKFLVFSNRAKDLHLDCLSIMSVRFPSPYTKRGLRLARMPIFKRPGKKSTY